MIKALSLHSRLQNIIASRRHFCPIFSQFLSHLPSGDSIHPHSIVCVGKGGRRVVKRKRSEALSTGLVDQSGALTLAMVLVLTVWSTIHVNQGCPDRGPGPKLGPWPTFFRPFRFKVISLNYQLNLWAFFQFKFWILLAVGNSSFCTIVQTQRTNV